MLVGYSGPQGPEPLSKFSNCGPHSLVILYSREDYFSGKFPIHDL